MGQQLKLVYKINLFLKVTDLLSPQAITHQTYLPLSLYPMLTTLNGSLLYFPILHTLLKSIFPIITKNDQWSRTLTQLSKVKRIYLIIENKLHKFESGEKKCPICENFLFQGNLFVLILHMEVQHEFVGNNRRQNVGGYYEDGDGLVVKKYEFTYDGLEIHLVKRSSFLEITTSSRKQTTRKSQKQLNNAQTQSQSISFKDYLLQSRSATFLQSTHKSRLTSLLTRIFTKFSKKLQTISTQRKYYHSYNVYQPINPDSQNSDQEREQPVEKQLERLRINDFNDVSYWDKVLYMEWNQLVRSQKKQVKIIDDVMPVLEKFLKVCKVKQIPKINLNMHLYTLWSVGKITNVDLIDLLQAYESFGNQNLQIMDKE